MNKLAEGKTEIVRDITTTKIENEYNFESSKAKKSDEQDNEIYYNENDNDNNSDNGYDNESASYKEDIKNDYIEKDMKKKKRETNEYNKISNIESNDDEKYDREEKYDTEKKKRYFR